MLQLANRLLGIRKTTQQSQLDELYKEYNNFSRPPNIEIAQKHAAATKFAKTDAKVDLDKTNVCPCCGLPIVIEELSVCINIKEFGFNGSGIALYFDFLTFAAVILFTYILIACGYDIYKNQNIEFCQNDTKTAKEQCNFFNIFSFSNSESEPDWIRSFLNFLFQIIALIMSLIYRRHINKIAMDLDDAAILASDYSIFVQNLPEDTTKEEIVQYFSKKFQNRSVKLKKICQCYKILPYIEKDKLHQLKEQLLTKVLELEKQGKTIPKSIPSRTQLESEVKALQIELDEMEVNRNNYFKFSGICILSYQFERQADYVCKTLKGTKLSILLEQLGWKSNKYEKFKNNTLYCVKAPEPGDILWQNLGISIKDQYKRFLITYIMTILLLIFGFGCLMGISYLQELINNLSTENSLTDDFVIQLLSIIGSFIILLINYMLSSQIVKFAELEQHSTITEFNISVAQKLGIAQFLNVAILTLIIKIFISGHSLDYQQAMNRSGGLNQSITQVFITNSILSWLLTLFDFRYFLKLYQREKIIAEGENCQYSQIQTNKIFEGPRIDLSKKYATFAQSLLFSFFYAALLPLGVIFTFCSTICIYWADKYVLVKRDSKPPPTGSAMAEEMVDYYMELVFLAFSVGCIFWEYSNFNEIHILTWIQFGLSALYYIFPTSELFGFIVNLNIDNATKVPYDKKYLTFYEDYDRRNPITADEAKAAWIKIQEETKMIFDGEAKEKEDEKEEDEKKEDEKEEDEKEEDKKSEDDKFKVTKGEDGQVQQNEQEQQNDDAQKFMQQSQSSKNQEITKKILISQRQESDILLSQYKFAKVVPID